MTRALKGYLESQRQDFLGRCTACGDCFQACPIVPLTPLKDHRAEQVVGGVLDVFRGKAPPPDATVWAEACTRCGVCIECCAEGVNPRKMLALAEGLAHEATGARSGNQFFRLMSRNIHLLSGLQLSREHLAGIQGPPDAQADVVFYAGCNLLSNPHIILNVMDVLGALGLDYQVAGGTGYCCGAVHFIGGELEAAGKVAETLYSKLAAFRPQTVLTWCPTCEMHLGEAVSGCEPHEFEVQHFACFLAERLDVLRERMTTSIPRRVAVHGHGGHPHIAKSVERLLGAIPELVSIELQDGGDLGYSCNVGGLLRVPSLQSDVQARVLQEARAAGADEIVDVFHGCHRLLWDGPGGIPVRNFTDLLVEAMGLPAHEDRFQQYRGMPAVEQVVETAQDLMNENAIDATDVERAFPGLFQR